jgi:nucleotide-binding universal stress UspA family protein
MQEVEMHDDGATSSSPVPADPGSHPLGVLLGFDGSDQSVRALFYAARAARRLGSPLTVVTAYTVPSLAYAEASLTPVIPAEVARLAAAQGLLDQAREHLQGYPGEVDLRTEHGDAAGVLVRLSTSAQIAVVGARGRGGFFGRLLGSVSSALPAHAHCPTIVVPRQYEVGTEGGPHPQRTAAPADGDVPDRGLGRLLHGLAPRPRAAGTASAGPRVAARGRRRRAADGAP